MLSKGLVVCFTPALYFPHTLVAIPAASRASVPLLSQGVAATVLAMFYTSDLLGVGPSSHQSEAPDSAGWLGEGACLVLHCVVGRPCSPGTAACRVCREGGQPGHEANTQRKPEPRGSLRSPVLSPSSTSR